MHLILPNKPSIDLRDPTHSAAERPGAKSYLVIVRDSTGVIERLSSISLSSAAAGESALAHFDEPVGVTVHAA